MAERMPVGELDPGSRILAYRLGATKSLGFGKGRKFSQTRWRL